MTITRAVLENDGPAVDGAGMTGPGRRVRVNSKRPGSTEVVITRGLFAISGILYIGGEGVIHYCSRVPMRTSRFIVSGSSG